MGLKNLKIAWSILATFFLLNLAGTVHAAINCWELFRKGLAGLLIPIPLQQQTETAGLRGGGS